VAAKTERETPRETEAANAIRSAVERAIGDHGWDVEVVAARLEMLPGGFELLSRRHWSLEQAWRVAEALGLTLELRVAPVE
jgi:hypothetical protein